MMRSIFVFMLLLTHYVVFASYLLIPMSHDNQQNHLKAYGITYWALAQNIKVQWLLNYDGGSFLMVDAPHIRMECQVRGVSYKILHLSLIHI